jgi:hypothetical protein
MAVSRKFCCLCVMCNRLVAEGMGGQGCFKHAKERRRRCGWMRIRRGVRRRRKRFVVFGMVSVVDCIRSLLK